MKQCPFKATAVQQQYQAERANADFDEAALEMAKVLFGECDGKDCQMWYSYSKEFADQHGFEPGDGWCGLIHDE